MVIGENSVIGKCVRRAWPLLPMVFVVACSERPTSASVRAPASSIRAEPGIQEIVGWRPTQEELRLTAELERRIGHPAPDLIRALRPIAGGTRYIQADDPKLQVIIDSIYAVRTSLLKGERVPRR